jgi:hypothetical protein
MERTIADGRTGRRSDDRAMRIEGDCGPVSGGARVSGARGQLSCLSPPSRWACGHPSSDVFFFWLIASLLIRLSISQSHSMKSMNKIMEDP